MDYNYVMEVLLKAIGNDMVWTGAQSNIMLIKACYFLSHLLVLQEENTLWFSSAWIESTIMAPFCMWCHWSEIKPVELWTSSLNNDDSICYIGVKFENMIHRVSLGRKTLLLVLNMWLIFAPFNKCW